MKAVILAAWYWTRMLPITKTIPKELLPVWDKPVIQYMIESLVENNIKDIVMITSQWKTAIEDYFDKNHELEEKLKNKNKIDLLEKINKPKNLANICFIKQKELLWTGHAVLQAEKWIDDNYFILILWDSIFHPEIYKQALNLHQKTWEAVIVAKKIPKEEVYKYWVLDIKDGKIIDMIEKPSVENAPANLIIPWIYSGILGQGDISTTWITCSTTVNGKANCWSVNWNITYFLFFSICVLMTADGALSENSITI